MHILPLPSDQREQYRKITTLYNIIVRVSITSYISQNFFSNYYYYQNYLNNYNIINDLWQFG